MPALSIDDTLSIDPDVVFRELDGEAVILNLETGIYFGLDDVGTRMWQLIAEHGSLRHVVEVLREEYEADDAALERDLLALATDLCAKGLTRRGEKPASEDRLP